MIEAAGRFKKVTDVVQSPELAKLFFESYGTEGLAPKKDKDPAAAYKDLVEKSGAQAKQMLADQKALIDTTISVCERCWAHHRLTHLLGSIKVRNRPTWQTAWIWCKLSDSRLVD